MNSSNRDDLFISGIIFKFCRLGVHIFGFCGVSMLRASKYVKKNADHPTTKITTRKQRKDAMDKGDIRGWLTRLPNVSWCNPSMH